jgi:hypothetical protein
VLLPDNNGGEGQEHGVDNAEHGINEAGYLVMSLEDRQRDRAADQEHAADGEQNSQPDDHDKEEYG